MRRLLLAVVLAAFPSLVCAQSTATVLSGTVRDDAGRPLGNALVVLDAQATRQTQRTDSIGVFRFRQVSPGEHELTSLWIGYHSDVRTIQVPQVGLDVQIVLRRNIGLVDTMHVTARRSGIYGTVVEHKAFHALAGVEVQVIGSGLHSTTGEDGHFSFPLMRPGAYVIQVSRDRYTAGMLSVVVPRDSALDLYLSMEPVATKADKKFAVLMGDFDRRVRWGAGSTSAAIIPRQELAEHQGQSLADALRYSMSYLTKGLALDDNVCMYVNGVFQPTMTAKDYAVSNIEAVEVYGTGADYTGTVTARVGSGASARPPGGQCGSGSVSQSLSTSRRFGTVSKRGDPSRVEAIVIWTK